MITIKNDVSNHFLWGSKKCDTNTSNVPTKSPTGIFAKYDEEYSMDIDENL